MLNKSFVITNVQNISFLMVRKKKLMNNFITFKCFTYYDDDFFESDLC